MLSTAAIAWLPWRAESFARARAEGRPVLLALAPTWCANSADMDAAAYADADVAALVNAHFIAVRVDADRRPDIAERYSLVGWPTTAFLTPDGDVLGGGTYIPRERLPDILRRVSVAFAQGPHVRGASLQSTGGTRDVVSMEQLIGTVTAAFDGEHGGFGGAPKFPHVAPVRLALQLYKDEGSEMHRGIAMTTLDAMGWGGLYDERDGGFFRYARRADWGEPNDEKLLEVNASLLDLYLDAAESLELGRYLERAADILRYVQSWLADQADGGWAGSQRADPDYHFAADGGAAATMRPPPVDRTLYTDWNAQMASAAIKAGRALQDPALSEFAIRSLERVALLCYQPGGGVAHYYDGAANVRGLLDDQIAMAAAQLDAFEATGNIVYEMLAEELALHAVNTMWDGEGGGFFDRAEDVAGDVGLLGERRKPFAANCAAARLLARLAEPAKKPRFRELCEQTLAAIGPRAAAEGALAADYVLAVRAAGR
jgi:uncharacterized protein YyaL (SSP411 family)